MISFVEHSHAAEANGSSSSQKIPHIVRDLKVHYGIYKLTLFIPMCFLNSQSIRIIQS